MYLLLDPDKQSCIFSVSLIWLLIFLYFKLKGTVRNSIAVEALFKTRNQQSATINFLNVTSIIIHRMPTNVMTQELHLNVFLIV